MAYLVKAPRVGRSQGAVIFWGLVSAFFSSAFCYYYLENRSNEEKNRSLVDQVMILQGESDSLTAERAKMEAAASDTQKQLAARQEFLQEKEANLAQEEAQLEAAGTQTQSQSQQSAAQVAGVKKFDDTVRKLVAKIPGSDVVLRGGRPVLRLPNSLFFGPGEAQLKADAKPILSEVAQAATGTNARFELRLETFTDGQEAAASPPPSDKTNPDKTPATSPTDAWTLTAQRSAAIARYLREQAAVPFQNVLALGRADFQPVEPGTGLHERNRRIEITITPVPAPFHAPETKVSRAKTAAGAHTSTTSPGTGGNASAATGTP